jgi:hypothetical protein
MSETRKCSDDKIIEMFQGLVIALRWHKLSGEDSMEIAKEIFKIFKNTAKHAKITASEISYYLGFDGKKGNLNPYVTFSLSKFEKDLQLFDNVFYEMI